MELVRTGLGRQPGSIEGVPFGDRGLATCRRVIMEKPSSLGPPSLELGGLRLWLRGQHFPWEEDFWNADWLVVTAQWRSPGAEVRAHGPFLHAGDLPRWLEACERLLSEGKGLAMLWAVKPELQISLHATESILRAEVRLSPDLTCQEHVFRFPVTWEAMESFARGLRHQVELDPLWKKAEQNRAPSPLCRFKG
jgi:hypothetical protein